MTAHNTGLRGEDVQEHPLRAPVLTELAECYGTDDWPWLSDLADVVVGLIEQHAQAVIDARWAAVFGSTPGGVS